ncbi:MAG: nuclear transport factor 2 family protein [Betaproteobacteria bacterium]|nr:nuclear transport factor 2 family protein [Betaproteobacteria bacterium]
MKTIDELVTYFETLTADSVVRMNEFYTEDAYFRDPFNEVNGLANIRPIFAHMYVAMHEPKFVILERVVQGDSVVLTWDFTFRIKRLKPDFTRKIHGLSLLKLAPDGRVRWHRDYWDAAGELYEQLPLVGALMRWLKRRLG